nr:TetR/AcrR family transcriptional regulator [Pseudomonas sp.]
IRVYFHLHAQRLAAEARGEQPHLVQLNDLRALPQPQFDEVSTAYTQMFRQIRQLLDGRETERLSRQELNARTHYVLSLSHWMRTWLYPYETHDYWRLADQVSDIVLFGMASQHAPAMSQAVAELEWQPPQEPGSAPEAFLRAASELVNEQGYLGASVDKISARLNVTKGAFYHHNQNKEDLVLQCFERTFGLIRCALQKAADQGGTGWQRTVAAVQALAHFQLSENGPMLRLGATSALSDLSRRAGVSVSVRRLVRRLAHDIVDGMVDGSIRPLDPLTAAQIATGAINSVSELKDWVAGADRHNVTELYVKPLFRGILCDGVSGKMQSGGMAHAPAATDSPGVSTCPGHVS